MKLIRAILNDLAVVFNKGLVAEIESLKEKIKKVEEENKKLAVYDEMGANYTKTLIKYRNNTIETIRDVYKIHKDFYSLMGAEFFDWEKCFDTHWEKRLYDFNYRGKEDKENLEVKEFGNFIIETYPPLVKKIEKSFIAFKKTIIKLTKKTKQQESRIKYLEGLCQSNLIHIN